MISKYEKNSRRVSLICSLLLAQLIVTSVHCTDDSALSWGAFKTKYGKSYLGSSSEASRKKVYLENLEYIANFNANESNGFKLGVNQFTDQTLEEFKSKHTGLKRWTHLLNARDPAGGFVNNALKSKSAYANTLNYQNTPYVLSVKNQGSCGSCTAFSSTAAVEAQTYRVFGKKISTSQQQLVDCSTVGYKGYWQNQGCSGGQEIFSYLYMANGMMSEQSYPYTGSDDTCKSDSSKYVMATKAAEYTSDGSNINGVYTDSTRTVANFYSFYLIEDDGTGDLSSTLADAVIKALNEYGPMSIGVCAGSSSSFMSYTTGVYYDSPCTNANLDHAILLVGYDISSSDPTQRYWIAKNQWGTTWGQSGYVHIRYGAGLIRDPNWPNVDTNFGKTSGSVSSSNVGSRGFMGAFIVVLAMRFQKLI